MTELFLDIIASVIVLSVYWSHHYTPATAMARKPSKAKSITSTIKPIAVPAPDPTDEQLSEIVVDRLTQPELPGESPATLTELVDRPVKVVELRRIAPSLGITNSSRMKRSPLHDRVLQAMLDRSLAEYENVRVTPIGLRVDC